MTRLTQRRKLVTRVVKVTPVAASIAALFFVAAGSAVHAEISAYGTALPINLNMARSLDVNAPTDTDDTNIYLRSHQMHSIPEEQIILTDEAEVRKAGAVLKGDKITYTFSKDEVYAQGNALVARQGTVFEGRNLPIVLMRKAAACLMLNSVICLIMSEAPLMKSNYLAMAM